MYPSCFSFLVAEAEAAGQIVGRLVGARHVSTVDNPHHLLGNFNKDREAALLVRVEEAFWSGDPSAVGRLKNMLTSETIKIEPKGIDSYEVKSSARFIATSNEAWVVPAESDARRFAVFEVGARRRNDTEFFGRLKAELEAGGYASLMHDLLAHDLTGFDVRVPPNSRGLLEQKLQSMTTIEQWWFGILEEGLAYWNEDGSGTSCAISSVVSSVEAFATKRRDYRPPVPAHVSKKLNELVPGLRMWRPREGEGERQHQWTFPELSVCRKAFSAHLKGEIDW